MEHEAHALWQLDRRSVNRFAGFQINQVHFDEAGQIFWQAADFNFVQYVADHGGGEFHSRRYVLIHEVHRHFHVDLFVRFNTLEIDVLNELFERVVLHVAQENLALRVADRHGQDRAVEVLFLEAVPQWIVIELDQFRFRFATIDDARYFCRKTQAAARTTAQR